MMAKRSVDRHDDTNILVSEIFSDREDVFASRADRIADVASSTFGDPVWDPDPVIPRRPNVKPGQRRIQFHQNPVWSLRSREVAMALLNPADPRLLARSVSFGGRTFSLGLARSRVESYKYMAEWQIERGLPNELALWRRQDFVELIDHHIARGLKNGTVRNLINAVRDLVALSPILTGGGLPADPWNGQTTGSIAKHAPKRETKVIAPARWIPLMEASWKYISLFADDILGLRQSHSCAMRIGMPTVDGRFWRYTDTLDAYLRSVDAVVPVGPASDGSLEPQWHALSRLVTGDLSGRIFNSGRLEGQRRRKVVLDSIASEAVQHRIMSNIEVKALLAARFAVRAKRGAGGARTWGTRSDEIFQNWIDHSSDGVALRRSLKPADGDQITEHHINWAMMERVVYGPDAASNLLRGKWTAARRRRQRVLEIARSGRVYVANKGHMDSRRDCVGFVAVTREDGTIAPWRDSLTDFEARCELRALRAACYIFIAAMTMMRDSEIQDIRRNPITMFFGVPAIKSNIYKGRSATTPAHWWIVDEVQTAIGVLESLSTHPDFLFARFVDGYHETDEPGINASREIEFFLQHVSVTGMRSGLAPVPRGPAISPRTLRRTTACMSRELGGNEIAVSQQLKHVISYGYSNVTAGYMAPDPAWASFLDTNRSEDAVRSMVAMIHQSINEAHPLGGRGGQRLTDALSIDGSTTDQQDQGSLLMTDAQIAMLLKKVAPEIYFGPANACMFDESTALCRVNAGSAVEGPLLGLCQPARCPNAVIGPQHLPVWISEQEMLTATVTSRRVSTPRMKALSARLADVEHVLNQARVDHAGGPDEH